MIQIAFIVDQDLKDQLRNSMNKFEIPSDDDLQKQLNEIIEECDVEVPQVLHGLDWFSFFAQEQPEE